MTAAFTLSLASIAAAMPAPRAEPTKFTGLAIHSGSDIQYQSLNANGLSFWLGKNTTTYCPEQAGVSCPFDNSNPQTIFSRAPGSNSLALSTSVPGGQIVYIDGTGALKFTQAHSGNTGEGATLQGFSVDPATGHVQFEGQDWYACPVGEEHAPGVYGIYAVSKITGTNAGAGCTGFAFRPQVAGDVEGVWQYV